jgi:hypothetical protein
MNYPQYPGGYDPYPSVQPAPNGATAIIAGVLAVLGSIANLLSGGLDIVIAASDFGRDYAEYDATGLLGKSWFTTYFVVLGVVSLTVAVLLGVGAVMMFLRKPVGRFLVAAGCVLVVVAGVAGFLILLEVDGSTSDSSLLTSGLGSGIGLIFPVITAILALLPATAKWLNYDKSAAYPQAGPASYQAGFAPYPQAGPAGYPQGPSSYPQAGSASYPQAGSWASGQPAQPGEPGYPQPDQLGYPQPVIPQPRRPVDPQVVQLGYPQAGQVGYSQAAQPGYPQAGQSADSQAGSSGYAQFSQAGDAQPGQPGQSARPGDPQLADPGYPQAGSSTYPQARPLDQQAAPSTYSPEQPQVYSPVEPVEPSADPLRKTDAEAEADDMTWRRPPS